MTILKRSVMLLKTQKALSQKDEYEELLKFHNFTVKQVNTLVFNFYNLPTLKTKLDNSDDYSGILLSSPRCVEAVHLALNKNKLDSSWKTNHKNYVVGEATHSEALQKLDLDCRGKESGNAKNLSQIIVEENVGSKRPFLFPHGNLKTDTLKHELNKFNISIEGVLVYDTLANPAVEEEFRMATNDYMEFPEYVVYFSPSGVRSSIEYFRKKPDYLEKIQISCLKLRYQLNLIYSIIDTINRITPNYRAEQVQTKKKTFKKLSKTIMTERIDNTNSNKRNTHRIEIVPASIDGLLLLDLLLKQPSKRRI
ncbi:hypothetical protein HHI36_007808 [Cryptolaemus montrouzieri]|uniref:Uroporphyrinogen-III synthase n=1 Tax=Cryptolaemus montrouzieri TaxID=559131 RepID=A0ABD2MRJ3_9CUCU